MARVRVSRHTSEILGAASCGTQKGTTHKVGRDCTYYHRGFDLHAGIADGTLSQPPSYLLGIS